MSSLRARVATALPTFWSATLANPPRRRALLGLLTAAWLGACGADAAIDGAADTGPKDSSDAGPGEGIDGASSDDPSADATSDAGGPACDPAAPFGAPVPITELNTTSLDIQARLSPDERVVYFASARPGHLGGGSIYMATRATRTDAFSNPTLLTPLNTGVYSAFQPTVTDDGLRIYLQASTAVAAPTDIYVATRADAGAIFGTPTPVPVVNSAVAADLVPFVTGDGTLLLFVSNRSGPPHLYQSVAEGGAFGQPSLVAGIPSADGGLETSPVLSADRLTLYYAATGGDGIHYHVFVAHRTTPTGPFTMAKPVPELNMTGASDGPSWLSPDNCRLYLASNRVAAQGFDIYLATRVP